MAQVNCNSDKYSSISTRSVCAVTECLPVYLGRTFEQSLGSRRTPPIFTPYAQIVEAGSAPAGLPCCRLLVEIRCRFTRQLVGGVVLLKDISAKGNSRSFILFRRKHWLLTIRKL